MVPLFLGLTLANLLCLSTAAVLGYASMGTAASGAAGVVNWHQLAGVIAAIVCCIAHCVVFTYFIATAKWVQHAVSVKELSQELVTPTRSFKKQAFPAALASMAAVFVTAVIGVGVLRMGWRPMIHQVAALATVAINLLAAMAEYAAIVRNGALVDQVLAAARAVE